MDFTEKKLNQILNLLNLIHNENTFIFGFMKNLFINEADRKSMEEYNDNGILIHQKNSDEESWWDEKGQLIHTKTKYLETFYEYDDKGRLIREFYPEGYEIKYEYNRKGLLVEEKDSEGHRVINTYVNGVLTEKTCFNPKGLIVFKSEDEEEFWNGYDDNGHVVYKVDPSFKDIILPMLLTS